jgi:hypothetical protein
LGWEAKKLAMGVELGHGDLLLLHAGRASSGLRYIPA